MTAGFQFTRRGFMSKRPGNAAAGGAFFASLPLKTALQRRFA
jgi:hypothetical protein